MSHRDDKKKRKKHERDRRQREYKQRMSAKRKMLVFSVSPRVRERFTDSQLQQLVTRTFDKQDPRNRLWVSYYRTLCGEIAVIVERGRGQFIRYLDELPEEIRQQFPANGWKYDDQSWMNYVKAMWRATDGRVEDTHFDGQPVPPGAVLVEPVDPEHCQVTVGGQE